MATRRDGREWALQILFGLDLNIKADPEEAIDGFMADKESSPRVDAFVRELVLGVMEHGPALDEHIAKAAEHWDVRRMGSVERSILRLAVYELVVAHDTPPPVVINEAVDICKFFSSRESGRFINGILDNIRKAEEARGSESA